MVKVAWQDVPAEYRELYENTLQLRAANTSVEYVRKRYPWRIPTLQGFKQGVSAAQRVHRKLFQRCITCYNNQPYAGGVTPPTKGFRNRSWWHNDAIPSGLWYFCWFMKQTLNAFIAGGSVDWCSKVGLQDTEVDEEFPDRTSPIWPTPGVWHKDDYELRSYLQKVTENNTAFHIKITSVRYKTGEAAKLLFGVYWVKAAWNENTLTWNNQPPATTLVASQWITGGSNQWITIEVPAYVQSIMLKLLWPIGGTSPNNAMFRFYAMDYNPATNRWYTD